MTDEFIDISDKVNPYKPGSEDWHRHNMGIKPGVIGQVDEVVIDEKGILIKGWFWGVVPERLSEWTIDQVTNEARLI